jgi:hypothetical protein
MWTGWETEVIRETLSNATQSTTNPTWPDPESNPDWCNKKLVINHLSYDMANASLCLHYYSSAEIILDCTFSKCV